MNIKTDGTHSTNSASANNLAKRKEKKDKERKELDELALDEIFAFQASIQENWQQGRQIVANHQQQNFQQEEQKPQDAQPKEVSIQNSSPHLAAAQQSFEQMNDQQIRQQLKKQLLRDYELGEHQFEINVQDLGKIDVSAYIQEDAWRFSLQAENSATQNWLHQQQFNLQQGLNEGKLQNPDALQNFKRDISVNIV